MYFWNIKQLKTDLIEGVFTEYDSFKYALATLVLFYLASVPVEFTYNRWDYILFGCDVLVCILGTEYCFLKNGGKSGKNFLQKYFSIGWVVGVRLVVFAFFLGILSITVGEIFDDSSDMSLATTWQECIFFLSIEVFLFWRVGVHIEDVALAESK